MLIQYLFQQPRVALNLEQFTIRNKTFSYTGNRQMPRENSRFLLPSSRTQRLPTPQLTSCTLYMFVLLLLLFCYPISSRILNVFGP